MGSYLQKPTNSRYAGPTLQNSHCCKQNTYGFNLTKSKPPRAKRFRRRRALQMQTIQTVYCRQSTYGFVFTKDNQFHAAYEPPSGNRIIANKELMGSFLQKSQDPQAKRAKNQTPSP
jgi:hypothetical protein